MFWGGLCSQKIPINCVLCFRLTRNSVCFAPPAPSKERFPVQRRGPKPTVPINELEKVHCDFLPESAAPSPGPTNLSLVKGSECPQSLRTTAMFPTRFFSRDKGIQNISTHGPPVHWGWEEAGDNGWGRGMETGWLWSPPDPLQEPVELEVQQRGCETLM